ncbi:hypothetical protein HPB50_004250 [Hyalomma asiaticum]|uniref:Uncharacterized protein n=1 Tax=Hyalomma asiaticum TaxID=266040 RepID=A0ACB7TEM8_HYAAI|nr:hypothetical protein HPB50_004250 [Hyalomma asiaticum]
MSMILKDKDKIISANATSVDRKRLQRATYADVKYPLLKWFFDVRAWNIPIRGPSMLAKVKDFALLLDFPNLCPENGWLHRFKAGFIDIRPNAKPEASEEDHSGGDCGSESSTPIWVGRTIFWDLISSDDDADTVERSTDQGIVGEVHGKSDLQESDDDDDETVELAPTSTLVAIGYIDSSGS